MKIFIFFLSQTPVKPILPSWLRTLCQFDITRRMALKQGHQVDAKRYVDDTGLQVAKLMVLKDELKLPPQNIGYYLGKKYIEANKRAKKKAVAVKLRLESQSEQRQLVKKILGPHLEEQRKHFDLLGFFNTPVFWESDLIPVIPLLIEELRKKGNILDYSNYSGPTFLDYTDYGMRLMVLKGNSGYTYVAKMLAFLKSIVKQYDLIILQRIDEDKHPFDYVERYLNNQGKKYLILVSSRVKLKGSAKSSRFGGWDDYAFSNIYKRFKNNDIRDFRVGLRIYFLSKRNTNRFEFSFEELSKKVILAQKIRLFLEQHKNGKEPSRDSGKRLLWIKNALSDIGLLARPCFVVNRYTELYGLAKRAQSQGRDIGKEGYIYLLNFFKELLNG